VEPLLTPKTFALDAQFRDGRADIVKGLPALHAPQGTIAIRGHSFTLGVPLAHTELPSGRQVLFREGRLTVDDVSLNPPVGVVDFVASATAQAALEFADLPGFGFAASAGLDKDAIEGQLEARTRVQLPMLDPIPLNEVRADARIQLTDSRSGRSAAGLKLNGATLSANLGKQALTVSGNVLLGGVSAKLAWQHALDATADRQPPARIEAVLDAADRDALGLDINHMIIGDLPIAITIDGIGSGKTRTSLQADLTRAQLVLEGLTWTKQPGRPATLQSDIVSGRGGSTELQNFKIVGEDIAADGWISLDKRQRLRAFHFSDLVLNVSTRFELQGRVSDQDLLTVKAKGKTYDGRSFFRSLFSAGKFIDTPLPQAKDRPSLDLEADIETVIGFNDTNLKNVSFRLQRRGDRVVSLEARGTYGGERSMLLAQVEITNGRRLLKVHTNDGGSALRMVDFYPSMRGGAAQLEVNLDGGGAADKTGLLLVDRFVILGDPVVTEVLLNSEAGRASPKVIRERVEFNHLRVPFSTGHGQFVLGESAINGDLLGATIRGKVDYSRKWISVEGTFVPLYGLNSIPHHVPILGPLLGGRTGEGLFGITFQVEGQMGKPQVIVNPLSLLTPGIFRQIFESSPGGSGVVPTEPPTRTSPRKRSSSSPAAASDAPRSIEPPVSESNPQRERQAQPSSPPADIRPPRRPAAQRNSTGAFSSD
jgi:hypothetical protein